MNFLYITLFFNIVAGIVQTFTKYWNQFLYPRVIEVCRQTSMTRGYRNWFQDLINVRTMPATILKNEVMYRQSIHSVAFVN